MFVRTLVSWFESLINPFVDHKWNNSNRSPFKLLVFFISQAKVIFLLSFVLGLISALLDIALYVFLGSIIDILDSAGSESIWKNHTEELVFVVIVVLLVRPIVGLLSTLVSEQTIQANFSPMIRWQVHRRIMKQSLNFFQTEFSGNLASKTWQSGQAATEVINSLIQMVWSNIVYIASFFFIVGTLDWRLLGVLIFWVFLFSYIAYIFVPLTKDRAKSAAKASSEFNGQLVDVYSNVQTIKMFSSQSSEEEYMRNGLLNFIGKSRLFLRSISYQRACMVFLSSVAMTLIGGLSIYAWIRGDVTVGQVAIILGLALRMEGQLNTLLNYMTGIFRAFGGFQSAMELALKPFTILDHENAHVLNVTHGEIIFENVTFAYRGEKPILKNFSVKLGQGEKVGLVGESGTGKSTIAHLLLRFFDVQDGLITIDGHNIRHITQESLHRAIGLVTQDISLLHRSVYENIRIGRPYATEEDIIDAAKRAHALDFIKDLVDEQGRVGLDAYVGEKGIQLSGGQRQRIAIARVILKNPPILILDEATSAMDSKLDSNIQISLEGIMRGKTVIVIAHRLSTIKNMNRIFVMDRGSIVESGTHDELLFLGKHYASLWKKQFENGDFV